MRALWPAARGGGGARTAGTIGKKDLKRNDATPEIRVDPDTYQVWVDGEKIELASRRRSCRWRSGISCFEDHCESSGWVVRFGFRGWGTRPFGPVGRATIPGCAAGPSRGCAARPRAGIRFIPSG